MGKHATEEDASSAPYSILKDQEKPQSFGVTRAVQKKLLTQPWNQSSQPPPFCPTTSQSTQLRNTQMSMSMFGFIAHALCPSTPTTDNQNTPRESPQTVTGNSYSIFTTKNYRDNKMH